MIPPRSVRHTLHIFSMDCLLICACVIQRQSTSSSMMRVSSGSQCGKLVGTRTISYSMLSGGLAPAARTFSLFSFVYSLTLNSDTHTHLSSTLCFKILLLLDGLVISHCDGKACFHVGIWDELPFATGMSSRGLEFVSEPQTLFFSLDCKTCGVTESEHQSHVGISIGPFSNSSNQGHVCNISESTSTLTPSELFYPNPDTRFQCNLSPRS
jgi:hypothetical protein